MSLPALARVARRGADFLAHGFGCLGVSWAVIEILTRYYEWRFLKARPLFWIVVLLCLGWAWFRTRRLKSVSWSIPWSNVSIEVCVGDVLQSEGLGVIPVSEFFDSQIGLPVSPKSLHGIFIQRCFGGESGAFDKAVSAHLSRVQPEGKVDRPQGKRTRFPIGTAVPVSAGGKRFLVWAFTKAHPITCKASADVAQMLVALGGLWDSARTHSNGEPLVVPLIGSGLSGVDLPPRELINLIVLSFIEETKKSRITPRLRVALLREWASQVDLRSLKAYWERT